MARRWQGRHTPRHRAVPPYPVGPAIREQGARFWLTFVALALLAAGFVMFFGWQAWRSIGEHENVIEMIREEWPT